MQIMIKRDVDHHLFSASDGRQTVSSPRCKAGVERAKQHARAVLHIHAHTLLLSSQQRQSAADGVIGVVRCDAAQFD